MENLWKMTLRIYEELFKQCSLNPSFEYKPYPPDRKIIFKFIYWLRKNYRPDQLTDDFLIQYFEFQFARYVGTYSTGYGRNKIMIQWLVGPKAIQIWESRNVRAKSIIRYKLNKDVKLRLRKAFANNKLDADTLRRMTVFSALSSAEEQLKQKFFNTMPGFILCENDTTLFHPASKWCQACNYAEECKAIQLKEYPKLAQKRTELYGNEQSGRSQT